MVLVALPLRDKKTVSIVNRVLLEALEVFKHDVGVDDDTVTDDAFNRCFMEESFWD